MRRSSAIIFFISLLVSIISPVEAEMRAMEDHELSAVIARTNMEFGISNSLFQITRDSFRITDSDGLDYLEFSNTSSNSFSLDTPVGDPFRVRIVREDASTRYLSVDVPDLSSNILPQWRVENISLSNTDLGSLNINDVALTGGGFRLNLAPDNGMINTEVAMGRHIGEVIYVYNTFGESFAVSGVHMAQSAEGDPEDPGTWTFTGPLTIGSLYENPMTLRWQVEPNPEVEINLPVAGAVRIENVGSGGVDFGPAAIDGIQVHSLRVGLP